MAKRPDGRLTFSVGASRSGKTQLVLTMVKTARRLLVWDVEGEFSAKYGLRVIEGRAALARFVMSHGPKPARVAYHGTIADFDWFCRFAFIWGMMAPADIVCEELAASTNAGKARGWWGILVSRGLKYGLNIHGIAQRGQEIDKSLLGNATMVNICRPNTMQDAEYMAGRFGLELSDIPDADLEVLHRHKNRTLTRSRVRFRGSKPYLAKLANFSRTY